MDIYKHKSHNVYVLKKKLNVIKNNQKIKFFHKGKSLRNSRFVVNPHRNLDYFHWFIRLPFLYLERNNSGLRIGTPNKYLWILK